MSFEIRELADLIELTILLSIYKKGLYSKEALETKVEKYLQKSFDITASDLGEALHDMKARGLIEKVDEKYRLTDLGLRIGEEWKDLLTERRPTFEITVGMLEGIAGSLLLILTTFLLGMARTLSFITIFLGIISLSITNVSSTIVGGKTEDIEDALSLKNLIQYSVNNVPDKKERKRSQQYISSLFNVLRSEISQHTTFKALIAGGATLMAGLAPLVPFMLLPNSMGLIFAFIIIGFLISILVYFRSTVMKIHWTTILRETILVIALVIIVSLVVSVYAPIL